MRADSYLALNGMYESRNRAITAIKAGCVFVNGKQVDKGSFDIKETDLVEIKGESLPYVSRGGFKLKGALDEFGISCDGLVCVDIGASTGGFTDVLLKHGASKVYAVDCGRGQLHASLVNDERVVSIEGFNARELNEKVIGEKCDMAVMDVSFISQTLLHNAVGGVLKEKGRFISLIKPQFEVGRANIGKGGIVKDKESRRFAIENVIASAEKCGFSLIGLARSSVKGGDGNVEYVALFEFSGVKCEKNNKVNNKITDELI